MQFRDFRHQIEPDEQKLAEGLEAAKHRFEDNLALLQLQQPELVKQLKEFELENGTLCVDRHGDVNILQSDTMTLAWPPREIEPDYTEICERLTQKQAPLLATTIQYSGANVLSLVATMHAPVALIYVQGVISLYASLHALDWRPALRQTQLIFQLGETIEHVNNDLNTLEKHGVTVKPCTVIQTLKHDEEVESVWHFEQALRWNHDCNPILRLHTHKFRTQEEFVLLNELISGLRHSPMSYQQPWSLILVEGTNALVKSALAIPNLRRVIFAKPRQGSISKDVLSIAQTKGVELEVVDGEIDTVPEKLYTYLSRLPKTERLSTRLYQGGSSIETVRLREMIELELRYLVQPTLGMLRTYVSAIHASLNTQHMLTRRSKWPSHGQQKKPALVIGNGPSLLNRISELKSKSTSGYVIFSCGTAISPLLEAGITPDYHLELEFHANHLANLDEATLDNVTLIAPLGFHRKIRELFSHHLSFVISGHPLDELAPHMPDDVIRLVNPFPTVANLAAELLPSIGAKELYFLGVDLAFQGEKHHSGGDSYQNKSMEEYLHQSGGGILTQSATSQPIYSKREFIFAAQQIKQAHKRFPSCKFYSLSEGLDIGCELIPELPRKYSDISSCEIQPTTSCDIRWSKYGFNCEGSRFLETFKDFEGKTQEQKTLLLNEAITSSDVALPHTLTGKHVGQYWSSGLVGSIASLLKLYEEQNMRLPTTYNEMLTCLVQQVLLYSSKI